MKELLKLMDAMLHSLQGFLPFTSQAEAWKHIHALEQENKMILHAMHTTAQQYTETFTQRDIYLSIQQVKSGTLYLRWRKKGVNGTNAYLVLHSEEGQAFLHAQSERVQRLYLAFNTQTLELNLAYSLRLNEIKRIRRYLADLQQSRAVLKR